MQNTAEQLPIGEIPGRIDRRLRIKNDTITWAAETMNGSMRSTFEFAPAGDELYSEDGGALTEVFDDAIVAAETIVSQKPNLLFELRRRILERGELDDMVAMGRGELPNTTITVSDLPPELMDRKKDVGGYNVTRKQTMLRVITRQPDGSIRVITQSLDRSDRTALEAIYHVFGEEPEEGELLGQRIHRELTVDEQEELVDRLTDVYDESLATKLGGSWHAGIIQKAGRRTKDTYEFAKAQEDLVDWFVGRKLADPVGANELRFGLAATMSARFEAWAETPGLDIAGLQQQYAPPVQQNPFYLHVEVQNATRVAALAGKTFSGCGASVSAEIGLSLVESQLRELGFGNKTDEEEEYDFDTEMYCVDCQKPPGEDEEMKMCGPCGLCRSCDKKHGGKG